MSRHLNPIRTPFESHFNAAEQARHTAEKAANALAREAEAKRREAEAEVERITAQA